MPHTHTAKKRLRQNAKRRLRNRLVKKVIKLQVRKVTQADAEVSLDQLQAEFKLAVKKLDKAAAKRVLHPNTAARKKAQLARLLNQRTKQAGGG